MGLGEKFDNLPREEQIKHHLAAYYSSCVWTEQELKELDKNYRMTREAIEEKKKKLLEKRDKNYAEMKKLREELEKLENQDK